MLVDRGTTVADRILDGLVPVAFGGGMFVRYDAQLGTDRIRKENN